MNIYLRKHRDDPDMVEMWSDYPGNAPFLMSVFHIDHLDSPLWYAVKECSLTKAIKCSLEIEGEE